MKILFTYGTREIGRAGTGESCFEVRLSEFAFLDIMKNRGESKQLKIALGMLKRYEELQYRELESHALVDWVLIRENNLVAVSGKIDIAAAE